jgi:hypothetical protein
MGNWNPEPHEPAGQYFNLFFIHEIKIRRPVFITSEKEFFFMKLLSELIIFWQAN